MFCFPPLVPLPLSSQTSAAGLQSDRLISGVKLPTACCIIAAHHPPSIRRRHPSTAYLSLLFFSPPFSALFGKEDVASLQSNASDIASRSDATAYCTTLCMIGGANPCAIVRQQCCMVATMVMLGNARRTSTLGGREKKKKLIRVKVYQTVPFRRGCRQWSWSGLMPVQISRFLRVVYVGERERESEKSGERKSEEYRS